MKRALKIIGWTLCGLVLTVVIVACIAIYLVFMWVVNNLKSQIN